MLVQYKVKVIIIQVTLHKENITLFCA
jgi:hypothetical protein